MLRELAEKLRDKLGDAVVLVGSVAGPKAQLVCTVSKSLTDTLQGGRSRSGRSRRSSAAPAAVVPTWRRPAAPRSRRSTRRSRSSTRSFPEPFVNRPRAAELWYHRHFGGEGGVHASQEPFTPVERSHGKVSRREEALPDSVSPRCLRCGHSAGPGTGRQRRSSSSSILRRSRTPVVPLPNDLAITHRQDRGASDARRRREGDRLARPDRAEREVPREAQRLPVREHGVGDALRRPQSGQREREDGPRARRHRPGQPGRRDHRADLRGQSADGKKKATITIAPPAGNWLRGTSLRDRGRRRSRTGSRRKDRPGVIGSATWALCQEPQPARDLRRRHARVRLHRSDRDDAHQDELHARRRHHSVGRRTDPQAKLDEQTGLALTLERAPPASTIRS